MMWMDSEFKRHKAIAVPGLRGPVLQKMNADSVGEDFAAAIWLSPNPNLGGGNQSLNKDMHRWVGDIAGVRGHKVPMLFIWGKDDPAQKPVLEYLKVLDMNFARDIKKDPPVPVKGTDFTGEKYFDAKLVGSKLLDANLGTSAFITKSYLENVLKKRRRSVEGPAQRRGILLLEDAPRAHAGQEQGRADPGSAAACRCLHHQVIAKIDRMNHGWHG